MADPIDSSDWKSASWRMKEAIARQDWPSALAAYRIIFSHLQAALPADAQPMKAYRQILAGLEAKARTQ